MEQDFGILLVGTVLGHKVFFADPVQPIIYLTGAKVVYNCIPVVGTFRTNELDGAFGCQLHHVQAFSEGQDRMGESVCYTLSGHRGPEASTD